MRAILPLFLVAGLGACATSRPQPSLYEQLGRTEGITQVVGRFVGLVGADTRIQRFFAKTDIEHLKQQLVAQICEASGGPCKYEGGSMKAVHEGLQIRDAHFDALVADLVLALNEAKVPKPAQDKLLGALGPMRGDIVER